MSDIGIAAATGAPEGQRPEDKRIEQRSSIGQFLWIGFYSALLGVVTLGIFSFWARTQQRRQMWKDTIVEGEPLEYTDKVSELFFGALLAGLLLTVVAAVLIGVPLLLSSISQAAGVIAGIVSGLVYVVALLALPGAAMFLARRYLLSRTTLRGVRFEQTGAPIPFGFGFFLQTLLTTLTLGIYAPIARLRIAEMFWDNAKYGSAKFSFDGNANARTEPVWPSFFLSYLGNFIGVAVVLGAAAAGGLFNPDPMAGPPVQGILAMYGALIVVLPVVILLAAWHEAVMIRQVVKLISIDGARLESDLGTWKLIGLYLTNLLLIIFTLGFGIMAAEMRVWSTVARSLRIDGKVDYDAIGQAESRGPSTGEGLASALDIGGAY